MNANEYRNFLGSLELDVLLSFFKSCAIEHFDGHYSILSFTTGHKAAFGTPEFDGSGRGRVFNLPEFGTLKEAVIDALMSARTLNLPSDRAKIAETIKERAVTQLEPISAYDNLHEAIKRLIAEHIEKGKSPKTGDVQPMIRALAALGHVTRSVVDSAIEEGKFRDCRYSSSWLAGVAWEWLECLRPWTDKHFTPAVTEAIKEQERDIERLAKEGEEESQRFSAIEQ